MSPASIAARAAFACCLSSAVRKRTTTLVSTARTPLRLGRDRGVHLRDGQRRTLMGQRTEHPLDSRRRESGGGLTQHAIGRVLNQDRKSVVEGKRVSVSVDLSGRRIIKTKKKKRT